MATHPDNHLATIVGSNVLAARKREGLTQQDVAHALGTSVSRVSGWERGEHMPSRSAQPPLARLLFDGDMTAMFRDHDPKEIAA